MGLRAHYLILDYINDLDGTIIEIGSSRGEGSTDFYAGLMFGLPKFKFYTIDFDRNQFIHANRLAEKVPNMEAFQKLGEDFLEKDFPAFNEKICYAYLDNFDWNYDESGGSMPWIEEQRKTYNEYGLEYSNANSALAHLIQTQLIVKNASDRCLIQFDDTYYASRDRDSRKFFGKGMTAINYLLDIGWNMIEDANGGGNFILANFTPGDKNDR